MKKFLCLTLAFMLLFMCGCNKTADSEETSAVESTVDDPLEDKEYEKIECVRSTEHEEVFFGFENQKRVLALYSPVEWSYEKASPNAYDIKIGNEKIGALESGASETVEGWKIVNQKAENNGDTESVGYIEKFGSGDTLKFRYRFVYSYKNNLDTMKFTLTVDYKQVGDFTRDKMLNTTSFQLVISDPNFNILSSLRSAKSIAILGNSFVASSGIGATLEDMLDNNGKDCNVRAYARGYATVGTYISDESLMSSIRNGEYDAVFMCGLYNATELENFEVMKEACDSSGTTLVIFPAHNETESIVKSAISKYKRSLVCLNWKNEINLLIEHGVDKWDMCINDSHYHSTSLAGYVGAHMIYRAMYGEVPEGNVSSQITQSQVNELLGDYVTEGGVTKIHPTQINYIK